MYPRRLFVSLCTLGLAQAWMSPSSPLTRPTTVVRRQTNVRLFMAAGDADDEPPIERTTFDQAGASLIEEEDQKRLEQMGDFDSNDSYQKESIEQLRAKVRERTKGLGLEKSKVTADYIKKREQSAREAGGPPGATQQDSNSFGGLDLSQISQVKQGGQDWDESMPTMFFDPEAELSKEEQEEADPIMTKNYIEQAIHELTNTNWPNPMSALGEVGIMFIIIAITTLLIVSWDSVLRSIYTNVGFIPTAEDIANYASRFDGLDLPDGWTSGMSDVDVQSYSDTINANVGSGMPEL